MTLVKTTDEKIYYQCDVCKWLYLLESTATACEACVLEGNKELTPGNIVLGLHPRIKDKKLIVLYVEISQACLSGYSHNRKHRVLACVEDLDTGERYLLRPEEYSYNPINVTTRNIKVPKND